MNVGNSTQVWGRPGVRMFALDDAAREPSPLTEKSYLRCSVSGLFLVPFCTVHVSKWLRSPDWDSTTVYLVSYVGNVQLWVPLMAAMKHVDAVHIRVCSRHMTLVAWMAADGYRGPLSCGASVWSVTLTNPSSAAVKNEWCYTSISPYAFIACAGHDEWNPRPSRLERSASTTCATAWPLLNTYTDNINVFISDEVW